MFVCDNSYKFDSLVLARVKGTALLSQETRGQLRARKGRRDSFVLYGRRTGSVPFSLRRRTVYVQMCFMLYIVHVMCSLSIRLPIVDLFILGSSSGIDKGKAPA